MAKDGEDKHGLQTTHLRNLGQDFQNGRTVTSSLELLKLNPWDTEMCSNVRSLHTLDSAILTSAGVSGIM